MRHATAIDALTRLRDGNRRFMSNQAAGHLLSGPARRAALADGQEPFAIILGCSDSRVPAEIVFDQGLGDLFVIRVAGNIVAPSQVGSVEFAAERFGTRLVVVLGPHAVRRDPRDARGAAAAARRPVPQPALDRRPRPAVGGDRSGDRTVAHDPDALVSAAVRANIRASADHLRHGSQLLEQLIETRRAARRRRRVFAGDRRGRFLRGGSRQLIAALAPVVHSTGMRLVSLAVVALAGFLQAGTPAVEPGFTSLFNGKDFSGWKIAGPTESFTRSRTAPSSQTGRQAMPTTTARSRTTVSATSS